MCQAGYLDYDTRTTMWAAGCTSWREILRNKPGMWLDYSDLDKSDAENIIQPGMLIFFDWLSEKTRGDCDHVGIVESYDSQTGIIHTIEGNLGGNWSTSTVKRMNRLLNSEEIAGFAAYFN